MYSRRAFTLVELLVVISIVSMLASIIMVQISLAQASGRDSVRTQQIRQIDLATQMYIETHKKAPLVDTGCSVLSSGQVTEAEASACFAVSTAAVGTAQHDNWLEFKSELSEFIQIPNDPCAGDCLSASAFPIGYTYVSPLAYQYYCQNGGDCIATDESYQVYAPMERETVPSGSEGATDAYAADPLVAQGNDEDAPSVPTNVLAVLLGEVGNQDVSITWDESSDGSGSGISGYKVFLIDNGNPLYEYPMDTGVNSYTFDVASTYLGHTLCFVVSAYDAADNNSAMSESDENSCVTVEASGPSVSAPTNLQTVFNANGSISFSWSQSVSTYPFLNDVVSYDIYKVEGENYTYRTTRTEPNASPYNASAGASAAWWGNTFCWTVKAQDAGGNFSEFSEPVCVP